VAGGRLSKPAATKPLRSAHSFLFPAQGSVCKTDGTCSMKDGTTMTMKDGQCMMMDGKMTTMAEMHKSSKMKPGAKMGIMKM